MVMLYAKHRCAFHNALRCKKCRCPKCKRGFVLEWRCGWYCSRRFAQRSQCDYEKGG